MNLNQLYYFKRLAELQHFTLAAKELYITQPSLSGSISSLEDELGIELFHREGRHIRLTKYGREFYQYVSTALNELEKGIEIAKEESGTLGGVIDIGCIPTIIGDYLPKAMKGYLTNVNPKTRFNLYNEMSQGVINGIKSEKFDIGFCSYIENEPDIEFFPVLTQELVLVVNIFNPLAEKDFIHMDELRGYPLVTYRQNLPIGKTISSLLKEHHLDAAYAYDDEITLGGLAASTDVAAITARTPFLMQFDNLKLIKLDAPKDVRKVYMCYSKNNYRTRPVELFASYVLEHQVRLD